MVIILLKSFFKLLITLIIFLITIILLKSSSDFKKWFYKHVLDNNISFTLIASKYEELFGSPIPFKNHIIEPVFNENLKYKSISKYKNGFLVEVENNLIPSLNSGLVIFIGKKNENLCVTLENEKVETNYCMLKSIGVKLYDHVNKGSFIGEVEEKLYLEFIESGEYLDYDTFI